MAGRTKDGVAGRVYNNATQTWTYNAAGAIISDSKTSQQYDVTGRLTRTQSLNDANEYSSHLPDGDGRQVKFEQKLANDLYAGGYEVVTRYRIYSTVLGKLLTEIDAAGQKIETHIYTLPNEEYRQMKAYAIKISGSQYNNYPEQIVSEFSDPHGTRARQWDRQTNTYKNLHTSPLGVQNEAINWQQLKDRFVGGRLGRRFPMRNRNPAIRVAAAGI